MPQEPPRYSPEGYAGWESLPTESACKRCPLQSAWQERRYIWPAVMSRAWTAIWGGTTSDC